MPKNAQQEYNTALKEWVRNLSDLHMSDFHMEAADRALHSFISIAISQHDTRTDFNKHLPFLAPPPLAWIKEKTRAIAAESKLNLDAIQERAVSTYQNHYIPLITKKWCQYILQLPKTGYKTVQTVHHQVRVGDHVDYEITEYNDKWEEWETIESRIPIYQTITTQVEKIYNLFEAYPKLATSMITMLKSALPSDCSAEKIWNILKTEHNIGKAFTQEEFIKYFTQTTADTVLNFKQNTSVFCNFFQHDRQQDLANYTHKTFENTLSKLVKSHPKVTLELMLQSIDSMVEFYENITDCKVIPKSKYQRYIEEEKQADSIAELGDKILKGLKLNSSTQRQGMNSNTIQLNLKEATEFFNNLALIKQDNYSARLEKLRNIDEYMQSPFGRQVYSSYQNCISHRISYLEKIISYESNLAKVQQLKKYIKYTKDLMIKSLSAGEDRQTPAPGNSFWTTVRHMWSKLYYRIWGNYERDMFYAIKNAILENDNHHISEIEYLITLNPKIIQNGKEITHNQCAMRLALSIEGSGQERVVQALLKHKAPVQLTMLSNETRSALNDLISTHLKYQQIISGWRSPKSLPSLFERQKSFTPSAPPGGLEELFSNNRGNHESDLAPKM